MVFMFYALRLRFFFPVVSACVCKCLTRFTAAIGFWKLSLSCPQRLPLLFLAIFVTRRTLSIECLK